MLFGYLTGIWISKTGKTSFLFWYCSSSNFVSISVEVLKELNVVNTKEGSTILGASVVDDIFFGFVLVLSLSFWEVLVRKAPLCLSHYL